MPSRTVVLDTNVLVFGALKEGSKPALLVERLLMGDAILVVCPAVLEEYVEVFRRPKFRRWRFPPAWLDLLLSKAIRVSRDPEAWPVAGPDPEDLVFLALAARQGATLVTGNLADFPAGVRKGVEVLSPAEYLAWLEGAG